eukprot:260661-Prorocentrum_minimum.AAC.1
MTPQSGPLAYSGPFLKCASGSCLRLLLPKERGRRPCFLAERRKGRGRSWAWRTTRTATTSTASASTRASTDTVTAPLPRRRTTRTATTTTASVTYQPSTKRGLGLSTTVHAKRALRT